MQDSVPPAPPVPPPRGWRYPKFDSISSTIDKHVAIDRSSMGPGNETMVYILEEGFMTQDQFWIDYMQGSRMQGDSKVLYRPEIVNDLVQRIDQIYAEDECIGLMVKGPQGVGKSYSLINLTRYLLASGNYWVTIIPDCNKWGSENSFSEFLLQSVGVDPALFKLEYEVKTEVDFKTLIADIDKVLSNHGKKWVFIFDQINRIFARKEFREEKDVGVLPFPFSLMHQVMKPGRIISIISASANNDVSHRDNHPGFEDFEHPTTFNDDEIKLLYDESDVARWNQDELEYATGRVPLYLNRWAKNPDDYKSDVNNEIDFSLRKLRREQRDDWEKFVESAIQCLMLYSSPTESQYFDRKFSLVQKTNDKPHKFKIVALFPLVEQVYRDFFWNDLFVYIQQREDKILQVCNDTTHQDVRGRLFEDLVIARFVTKASFSDDIKMILKKANINVNLQMARGRISEKVKLPDTKFPNVADREVDITCFIPSMPNFPAVDFIIHVRKIVIAIQIHISDSHEDVLETLKRKVREAGWNQEQVQNIILLYLSPSDGIAQNMKGRVGTDDATTNVTRTMKTRNRSQTESLKPTNWIITQFFSKGDFASLRNMQWIEK